MASKLTPEESIALIKANLAEVLNEEIIENVIFKEKRPLKVYWGTATTGRPHCEPGSQDIVFRATKRELGSSIIKIALGSLNFHRRSLLMLDSVPCMKIAELLAAGCHVKILLADIHGYLDNMKAPIDLVEYRAKYYEKVIKASLKAVGVDLARLEFVLGSSYQLNKDYTMDRFKLEGITRVNVAQKAGAEVVKQTDDPTLGGLIYPLMQALDEQYLDVDAQFGGVDQRKIFTFAMENLPKIGYSVRAHLMNSMVPGLGEAAKMSASDPDSKIDLLDDAAAVEKKLKKAKCVPKEVEGNGVIAFVEHVIFRALALKIDTELAFTVERRDAEPLIYTSVAKLKEDYAADILTPQLLKAALTHHLNDLLKPIVAEYAADEEWQKISEQAYPPEKAAVKVKKVKDKGDPAKRAAAAAARKGAIAQPDGHVEGPGAEKVTVGPSTEETLQKLKVSE